MTVAAKKAPAKAGPRQATAARKPAKRVPPPTNGSAPVNGVAEVQLPLVEPGAPPPQSAASLGLVPKTADPQEFIPTTQPAGPPPAVHPVNTGEADTPPTPPEHPYGDRPVYVFNPPPGSPAGEAPIVFPHMSTVRPSVHFMWKLRKLNQQAVPNQLDQAFEWMDMAEVPDAIQERVTKLGDDVMGDFFLGWFGAVVNPPTAEVLPGES